jgi:competence protein ComEC
MRYARLWLLFLLCFSAPSAARNFDVYFIDVEGGQATLMVSPSGESLLVDTGWSDFEGRDADRIMAAAKSAGLKKIDYLVVTHYHRDHVGGVPELAEKIPIAIFVDHGPSVDTSQEGKNLVEAYRKVRAGGRHILAKPGDKIPLKGLDIEILSSAGKLISAPLPGAGSPNPLCAKAQRVEDDLGENGQSIGMMIRYGKFRLLDLGDLSWNGELDLACPKNLLGTADVYLTTHHASATSGPAAMVHALHPRVAIMNNGARKGGAPDVWQALRKSPGLQDIWQLHYSVAGGDANNAPPQFIANVEENCKGYGLKLSVNPDGSFTVTNGRNGLSKTYTSR